jgi:uncharacterized membrane protein YheB (UPF0754 family)
MAFIARSGIYFGFALGLVQTLVWALTREPIVLPLFGMCIGLVTDWLAIKLVFFPRERRLGFQGIFQRRRDEVAEQYGELIAREVMTVPNILEAVLNGPRADRLKALVQKVVWQTVDEQAALARPVVAAAIGDRRLTEMKREAALKAIERLPDTIRHAEDYLTETLDVGNTIATKMRDLTRAEYEGLLRPAFRRDEWKLIAVGAAIGFLVGDLQILLL